MVTPYTRCPCAVKMGQSLSKCWRKRKTSTDSQDSPVDKTSSCNLTEYWTRVGRDFYDKYSEDKRKMNSVKASDFRVTTLLDRGSFGSVALTTHTATGKVYATKVISKKKLVKKKLIDRTKNEKRILESIDFPFVIRLEYFYQDPSYLYFVMPYISGGNFYTHVQRYGSMDEGNARFYTAEVFLAVEYLHRLDLIHRDIKPENVLIDVNGHARLADFGFCKHLANGRTYTFCGTPEYMAPEILHSKGYGKSVDYWAMGVLLYELVAGFSPFHNRDVKRIFRNVAQERYSFPRGFSGDLMNLLRNLLKKDVTKRLGNLANGVRDIKKHRWYRSVDWCSIFHRQVAPPFVPNVTGDVDTSNFEAPRGMIFLASSKDRYDEEFKDF